MSGAQPPPSERCFNENSPRPPVPGEEGEVKSASSRSSSRLAADPSSSNRRSSSCDASCAPLGYEPEGRCDRVVVVMEHHYHQQQQQQRESTGGRQQLACLQWSRSLHALLEDQKGVKIFEDYLQQEGHRYALSFWFACEGLKDERDEEKLGVIIKAVIRRFFQRPQLAVPDDMRKELTRRFHDSVHKGVHDKTMFDPAQQQIYQLLEEAYPNFLRSDIYVKHVRRCQSRDDLTSCLGASSTEDVRQERGEEDKESCYSSPDEPAYSASLLPTLIEEDKEDSEPTTQQQHQQTHTPQSSHHHHHHHQPSPQPQPQHTHHHPHQQQQPQQQQPQHHQPGVASAGEMRLTKDMLMATQQYRAKSEAYAGVYLQPGASPYHAGSQRRAQYSSYNPVSRQDSELQSLSSDARTESDNLSLTDASLSDSASLAKRNIRKQHLRHAQQIKKNAMQNRESDIRDTIIPRTQLLSREHTRPMNPQEFARILIEKLERVKRERDSEETLVRKLKEIEPRDFDRASSIGYSDSVCGSMSTVVVPPTASTVPPNRGSIDALLLQSVEEDNDQSILDQHVSRIWSDLTPSRSPKVASPRPRSPDKLRRQVTTQQMPPQQQPQVPYPPRPASYRSQRKERDVFSTFSGDSGNVHDLYESSEIYGSGSSSSLGSHLPKSKSVPSDYADSLHTQDMYLQGQDQRYRRLDQQRSSAVKKSMAELTDSGVSVVSDATSAAHKDRLVSLYRKEASCASGVKAETMNVNKLNRNKKFANSPQQPFIGDPGMPLLPQPHTATQLEEAKRRLEYEQYEQNRVKQLRYPSGSESMSPSIQTSVASNQSTLRRGEGGSKKEAASSDAATFTTVVLYFCEEKVPYRTKISGTDITLKQFKDVLPKKGSYRYFFKTECEDLDMQVIQEEITEDTDRVPLWEGRIMAQVKSLE